MADETLTPDEGLDIEETDESGEPPLALRVDEPPQEMGPFVVVFSQLIAKDYAERDRSESAPSMVGEWQRFSRWLRSQDMAPGSMPADAVQRYSEKFANLSTRNVVVSKIKALVNIAARQGTTLGAEQTWPIIPKDPEAAVRRKAKQEARREEKKALRQAAREASNTPPPKKEQPMGNASAVEVPAVQEAQVLSFAPPQQVQKPRPATDAATFAPAGFRYKVSKKGTGYDGNPPGSLLAIHVYPSAAIASAGSVENFVTESLVPNYGPRAGGPDVIYLVETVNEKGQIVRSDEYRHAAPLAGAPGMQQPQGPFQPQFQPPPPSSQQAQVQVLDSRLQRLLEREERELETLREQAKKPGLDPYMLLMISQQQDKKQAGIDRLIDAIEARSRSVEAPPAPPVVVAPPPQAFRQGLGDFPDFFAPPPAPPAPAKPTFIEEAAAKAFTAMADRAAQPTPAPVAVQPPMGIREFIELNRMMQPPPAAPTESVAMVRMEMELKQMQRDNQRMHDELRKPAPSKTVSDSLAEMVASVKALQQIQQVVSPGEAGPGVIQMILENIPALADGFTRMLGAIPQQAPQVVIQGTTPTAAQEAKPKASIKVPVEVQKAVVDLGAVAFDVELPPGPNPDGRFKPETEQRLLDLLWAIVVGLDKAGEPWNRLANKTVEVLGKVDSRPEVRGVVTNLLVQIGGKRFANDPAYVEKLTYILHKYAPRLLKALLSIDRTPSDWAEYRYEFPAPAAPAEATTTQEEESADGDEEDDEAPEGGEEQKVAEF